MCEIGHCIVFMIKTSPEKRVLRGVEMALEYPLNKTKSEKFLKALFQTPFGTSSLPLKQGDFEPV